MTTNGFDAIRQHRGKNLKTSSPDRVAGRRMPPTGSPHPDLDSYVDAALRAGASGFLLKDAPSERLRDGIRIVASGQAPTNVVCGQREARKFTLVPEPCSRGWFAGRRRAMCGVRRVLGTTDSGAGSW